MTVESLVQAADTALYRAKIRPAATGAVAARGQTLPLTPS